MKSNLNKELILGFIRYCKAIHIMAILDQDIEPLADDYLSELDNKHQWLSNEFASCEHCGWAIEDCNCLPESNKNQ